MSETVKLNLYDVDKCGFYEDGSNIQSFGELNEVLMDLHNWVDGLLTQETKTYDEERYKNRLPTFSLDIVNNYRTGDYLLATWNQTPTDQGNFASINLNSTVGQYDVDTQEIPEGHAPGYATYFWFLTEFNKFCTVRFNNRLNGHPNLKLYLKNYLETFSDWVIDVEQDDQREVLGYGIDKDNVDPYLNPVFESRPAVKTGDRNYLVRNSNQIRKVMRKNRIRYENFEHRKLTSRMLNRIGIHNDQVPEDDYHDVRFEIDREFSEDEVGRVYDYWLDNLSDENNQIEDIGFRFRGNPDDYWLSRIIQKREFDIEVLRRNEEVVDAESLLKALIDNTRKEILKMF